MTSNLKKLKLAVVQMAIVNDPWHNAEHFLREARKATEAGANIVVGPEMMLSHYVSGDRYEDDSFINELWAVTMDIIAQSKDIDAVLIFGGIGLDESEGSVGEDGRLRKYNAAFVVHQGKLVKNLAGLSFAPKTLMPNYRIFDDSRHFFGLRKLALERNVPLATLQQPFLVRLGQEEIKLGVMLCEDMWDVDYAQKPAKNLADNGADILINLSCSPWSWQKSRKRDQVVQAICETTGLPFVYVNNVGVQNNGKNFIVFDGASTVYDGQGNIVALTPRYETVTKLVTFSNTLRPLTRPIETDVAELYEAIVVATRGFQTTLPVSIRDKVVIAVSGGMDSALSVAFFAHLMGAKNVIAVNLPYGDFNAPETKEDAWQLCHNLGVEYRVIPIDAMVNARLQLTGTVLGSSQHKTMQAIERMSVLATVAAKEGAFFTCNANMTEAAFGYGTLNGDMRGTWAPWVNCLKQDVYRLAHYLNQQVFAREVIPQSIIDRQPMDELTAPGAGVRGDPFDYGNLTKNGYHDQMVRSFVAFRRSPEWFLSCYLEGSLETQLKLQAGQLKTLFPTAELFVRDLERCVALFQGAIFKRVQSVPGPLVDKRSFGWDLRESILPWVQTQTFNTLKQKVLIER